MNVFPLQRELIDAVVGFINAKLTDPKSVNKYFNGSWQPKKLPTLRGCRKLQTEVRGWLLGVKHNHANHVLAIHGYSTTELGTRDDDGIQLKGRIYLGPAPAGHRMENQIAWDWQVSEASLQSICALAVATICQEGLHEDVHECKRDGCANIFVDRHSRGKPRQYCKTKECDNARNRFAVSKSARKKRKAKTRRKRTRK